MSPSMMEACGTSERIRRFANGIAVEPPVRNTAVMAEAEMPASAIVCLTVAVTRSMSAPIVSSRPARVISAEKRAPGSDTFTSAEDWSVSAILARFDQAGHRMPVTMVDNMDEAVDKVGPLGLEADLPQIRHCLGGVDQVDALPGREVDEIARRQIAFVVLGPGQIAELGHDVGDAEQPVEVGAADMDAAIGEDVALRSSERARSGETRTTEKSEVPPPMSTISASSSRATFCS